MGFLLVLYKHNELSEITLMQCLTVAFASDHVACNNEKDVIFFFFLQFLKFTEIGQHFQMF